MVRCCQGQIWSTIRAMSEPVYHQFKLRMPVDLFRRLEAAAAASNRSVSAEILHRVDRSFALGDGPDKEVHLTNAQLRALVQSVVDQVTEQLAGEPESLGRTRVKPRRKE